MSQEITYNMTIFGKVTTQIRPIYALKWPRNISKSAQIYRCLFSQNSNSKIWLSYSQNITSGVTHFSQNFYKIHLCGIKYIGYLVSNVDTVMWVSPNLLVSPSSGLTNPCMWLISLLLISLPLCRIDGCVFLVKVLSNFAENEE